MPMIGIIGAGKVGTSLGSYLTHHGQALSGFYSKTRSHAQEAAKACESSCYLSLRDIVADSDCLLLTVPDDQIAPVWEEIKAFPLAGKTVCHTSGLLSSAVFTDAKKCGVKCASMHMMCAVGSRFSAWETFQDVVFTVEGDASETITALLSACHNTVCRIDTEKKALYHAAGVFSSNFVVGLLDIAQTLLKEAGIPDGESRLMLEGLVRGNVDAIFSKDTVRALSGPLERGDTGTLKAHLGALDNDKKALYLQLSKALLPIAKQKNPKRDYQAIEEVIFDETYCKNLAGDEKPR